MSHLTYAEAIVVGLIQGVTELFPVSSLGHNVLIPALIGGSWAQDLNVSKSESPYLAFIVGLHVATALAMIIYFWRDWLRIIGGFFTSLRDRQISTPDQRLAWLIIVATIPVGIAGLLLEHLFRVVFSKPILTAIFLACNGLILFAGEWRRRRTLADMAVREASVSAAPADAASALARERAAAGAAGAAVAAGAAGGRHARPTEPATAGADAPPSRQDETEAAVRADGRLARLGFGPVLLLGGSQILALLPGISRDGMVTVTGIFRGLSREDAVRFSFLLSAPVILAAGALKIPDLTGPLGAGIRGQVLVGSLLSFIGAYLSVRFLTRYFSKSGTLTPFAIYCLVAGLGSLIYLLVR
jgi:undecaprenyl-diphosphatase